VRNPGCVVVIGGGLAGLQVVEELRRQGCTSRVAMIAAESHYPYDRPPLTKKVLVSGADEPPYLRTRADLAALDFDLRLGVKATRLRPGDARVDLADGTNLAYDVLVLATGAEPRRLRAACSANMLTLRRFDDAVRLRTQMLRAGHITVVGAGFIGCEVAASARQLGVDVTLVEAMPTPLARALGTRVGDELADMHRQAGVDLRCDVTVRGLESRVVNLSDGTRIASDVVLVALGVEPETRWLTSSGIELGDGVLCDTFGRTSLPGVWAVGDVAAWRHPRSGRHRRIEHWTTASEQARVVAANIVAANGDMRGRDQPDYFWSVQYGVTLQCLGQVDATHDVELVRIGAERRMLAIYSRAGAFTGVVGFSAAREVRHLRQLLVDGAGRADAVAVAEAAKAIPLQ